MALSIAAATTGTAQPLLLRQQQKP